jgi:PIN domain nuclease of toxin-antitoxin system
VRLLLDTHVLRRAPAKPARLPSGTRDLAENREHEVLFSAANLWEIAIKRQIGRLPASARPDHIAQAVAESARLRTADRALRRYSDVVEFVE